MKLLIVRIGALGDVLHALPAVAALRRAQPDWHIDWVVDPRWAPVLINSEGTAPIVNHVHFADTKLWTNAPLSRETLASVRTLRRTLRAASYDLAIDMQGTLRSAVIGRFAHPPIRAGYADPRESAAALFYTHKLPRQATHVVDQGAALLSAAANLFLIKSSAQSAALLGRDFSPAVESAGREGALASEGTAAEPSQRLAPVAPEIPHEPWADHWAAEEVTAAPLCVLAPGAGWGAKRWPASNFAALAIALKAQGFDVAVNAPRKDNPLAAEISAASNGAARTLVSNVTGLIALLRRATLVIGNDSGPTHLAAALGTPTLALFGPTSPARNGPWGPGPIEVLRHPASTTSYKRTETPDPGLAQLTVTEALQTALKLTNLRQ